MYDLSKAGSDVRTIFTAEVENSEVDIRTQIIIARINNRRACNSVGETHAAH